MVNSHNAAGASVAGAGGSGPSEQLLKGRIGVFDLVLMVLAWSAPIVVVTGISGLIIGYAGAAGPVAFVVPTVILFCFAFGFIAMTRYVENPGAFYAYITAGLGKVMGLGSGFLAVAGYFLLGLGTVGFFGVATNDVVENILGGPAFPWWLYGFACVVIVGLLGYFRIDLSAKVLAVAMILEVGLVALFDARVLFDGGPEARSLESFSWDAVSGGSIGIAILFAATCFSGFEATAVFREEARNPRTTVKRATYAAIGAIGFLYIISTWSVVLAYGPSNAQAVASESPATMFPDAVGQYVGVWARDAVSVLVASSCFAAVLSVQNILSRYFYSFGVDNVLPKHLGSVHPRHGSPHRGSLAVTGLLTIGTLWLTRADDVMVMYGQLVGVGGFAILSLIALTGISIVFFFVRRKEIESRRGPILAGAVSAVAIGVVLYMALTNFTLLTGGSAMGAVALQVALWGTFCSGVGLALRARRSRPDVYARIGRQSVG